MADIELVIKISENDLQSIGKKVFTVGEMFETVQGRVYCAIVKGTQLPKGHGDLIDKNELLTVTDYNEYLEEEKQELKQELKQEPIFDRDCEQCSKTYGTLGCCDTVNNEWVYSCKEGQREYLLNKIRTEIEKQDKWLAQAGYNAYNVDIAFNSIKRVAAESEDTE